MACIAVCAASTGYSGCLLGKTLVPDDVNLVPLVPPAIVEDYSAANPTPPGALLVFGPDESTTASRTFHADVIGGTNVGANGVYQLEARFFIDRAFPTCVPPNTTMPESCGGGQVPRYPIPMSRVDGVPTLVHVNEPIIRTSFANPPGGPTRACHTVDMFVSSQFVGEPNSPSGHLPATEGDVAHVRWYVYDQQRGDPDVSTIPATACLQSP